MLADDEQHVRETMHEILESLGYQVIQAQDGLQALKLFKTHQQDIALAILDVVMPHLGGTELAAQLRAFKPDLPVIFMTGYDQKHVLEGMDRTTLTCTLTKPIAFDALNQNIREILD